MEQAKDEYQGLSPRMQLLGLVIGLLLAFGLHYWGIV